MSAGVKSFEAYRAAGSIAGNLDQQLLHHERIEAMSNNMGGALLDALLTNSMINCVAVVATFPSETADNGTASFIPCAVPRLLKKDCFPSFWKELSRKDAEEQYIKMSKISATRLTEAYGWDIEDVRYPYTRSIPRSDREAACRSKTLQVRVPPLHIGILPERVCDTFRG